MAEQVESMVYVASQPGKPGYCAVVLEDASNMIARVLAAREVARWIKSGWSVDRVPMLDAAKGGEVWAKRAPDPTPALVDGPLAAAAAAYVPPKPEPIKPGVPVEPEVVVKGKKPK